MNTKQAQARAKLKRQQQALAKKHDSFFADKKTMWAKYGVFNTRHEMEATANAERLCKNKPILPLGDNWKFWCHDHKDLISYEQEIILRDQQGVTDLIYQSDNITFTRHSLEQIYVRNGYSIEKNYQRHLGLNPDMLQTYYKGLYGSFEKVLGSVAFRSDIILPFRQGALLGNVRLGESFHIQRLNNKYYIKPQPNPFVFRAETWISKELLRRDQAEVCNELLQGNVEAAIKLMLSLEAFHYEEVDYNAIDKLYQEAETSMPLLDKLV